MVIDGEQQRRGVADHGDHIAVAGGEQLGEALAEQHRVLGDQNPHGSTTRMEVGPPVGLAMVNVPSTGFESLVEVCSAAVTGTARRTGRARLRC